MGGIDPRYIEWGHKYSDGCTGVTEAYKFCCYEHDYYYRHCADCDGQPVTRSEADRRFRKCMQDKSRFGWWSPMALWRWAAVRVIGYNFWTKGGVNAQRP